MRRLLLCLALGITACRDHDTSSNPDAGTKDVGQYVIEIDIDDHGLKALWNAQAPNLKRMIREGTLAYTRVIVPTHSNQSNMTLVTGNYPDGHNVPTNSWLDRKKNFGEDFSLGSLGTGDYIFYDHNPLNPATPHHVSSVWSTVDAASLGPSVYVGQLPPWELGATQAHFTLADTSLFGIPLSKKTITSLLTDTLRYPADYFSSHYVLDGPPSANETIEHFTIRDAAEVWGAAAQTAPPRYMFVWAFIALDDDPTSTYGADTPQLAQVVDDYDDALGKLLDAIDASPYKGHVNILFTLDHGKVNTDHQCVLGSKSNDGAQLANAVVQHGNGLSVLDYDLLNEDGDALVYARTPDAGTPEGVAHQLEVTHKLVDLVQSGILPGVDTTRTITWDGYAGTRRMHDYRIESPNQADFLIFPQDGWTLNDVDGSGVPGPIDPAKHPNPYGRHGGFSEDELYVPLIMWGPAFRAGVTLPHPVNHPDVAPTAMAILGQHIDTAEGAVITDALVGDTAEAITDPSDMTTMRDTVLTQAGFHGQAALAGTGAQQAVIVDVRGLSYDEAFTDDATRAHLPKLNAIAQAGVRFSRAWNRYRASDENRYELLAGSVPNGLPDGGFVPTVEADPTYAGVPGRGLLLEPSTSGVPNPDALASWRGDTLWADDDLLVTADAQGFATAVIGDARATAHLPVPAATQTHVTTDGDAAAALQGFLSANPKAIAVVAIGGARTSDRHAAAALSELDTLDATLDALHAAAPNALFVLTSRNGADIDEDGTDVYGPQSARHVPLVIAGGPARSGVISGQPATAADVPATVLFGLGLPSRTDFVEGTWISAGTDGGIPQPMPTTATAGHALTAAFGLR